MAVDDRLVRHPGPRGTAFTLEGRRLSGADPRKSQQSRLQSLITVPETQTLYCIQSPLLGYGLREFYDRLDAGSAVLAVELDPTLASLFDDPESEIPRGVRLARATTEDSAITATCRFVQRLGIRRIRLVRLSGGAGLQSDRYRSLQIVLDDCIRRFWLNRATELKLNHRWVINILRNTLLEARPVRALVDRFRAAVLLVGAGPGLDEHLRWLTAIDRHHRREEFTLVAVDTALGTLAARGIRPDIVWSMDSQLVNARDFLPWRWDSVTIVADLSVAPGILRRVPRENRFVFSSRYAEVGLFSDPQLQRLTAGFGYFEPRGSVVPSVAEFLIRHTRVARVVTVGIDFWYRPPKTHAKGSAIDRAFRREMCRLRRRDGFEEVVPRPRVSARFDSGETTSADSALADHAGQFRALLREQSDRDIAWLRLPAPALPTGLGEIDPETATGILTAHVVPERPPGDEEEPLTGGFGRSDAVERTDAVEWTDAVGYDSAIRREALHALLYRLRAQEKRFDTASSGTPAMVFWDSGLDFILRDLPQWPLMMVRRDWFDLHRDRLLRVLRDYRRRLERLLRVS